MALKNGKLTNNPLKKCYFDSNKRNFVSPFNFTRNCISCYILLGWLKKPFPLNGGRTRSFSLSCFIKFRDNQNMWTVKKCTILLQIHNWTSMAKSTSWVECLSMGDPFQITSGSESSNWRSSELGTYVGYHFKYRHWTHVWLHRTDLFVMSKTIYYSRVSRDTSLKPVLYGPLFTF